MSYTLNIDRPALTLFTALPLKVGQLLIKKAQILRTKPFAGQSLKGKYRLLRSLHVVLGRNTYHIIYQIFRTSETIVVRLAAPQGRIYKKLDEVKLRQAE